MGFDGGVGGVVFSRCLIEGSKTSVRTLDCLLSWLRQAVASMALDTRSVEIGGRLYAGYRAMRVTEDGSGWLRCKECIN